MTDFFSFLREAMAKHKLSVVDCATLFDVSVPSVQRWIDGETIPSEAFQNIVRREIKRLEQDE